MRGHSLDELWSLTFASMFGIALYEVIARDMTPHRRVFIFGVAAASAALWWLNRRHALEPKGPKEPEPK